MIEKLKIKMKTNEDVLSLMRQFCLQPCQSVVVLQGNGRIALSTFGHIGVFLSILDTNTMVEITLARRIGVRKVTVMIKNF